MTKEELEKEAEEYAKENYCDEVRATARNAYLDCARLKEKQIQIDAEQIRALQKQNGELTDKVKELQNENFVLTVNEIIEGKDKKIAELEAQIEKMKKYIKACWVEENLNDYSSYITNTSDEFRDLVKELNEEVRNGR